MCHQPITLIVLAQFYRQVILPDIERVVGASVHGCERRIHDELRFLDASGRTDIHELHAEIQRLREDIRRLEERMEPLS